MISRSESSSGFTMLEALVALGLISLMVAIVAASQSRPSDGLELKAALASLSEDAARNRAYAVLNSEAVVWRPDALCPGEASEVVFFPDGTASPTRLCIRIGSLVAERKVHALTGRVVDLD